jgi:cell wall-associated NlpC family hydrolase
MRPPSVRTLLSVVPIAVALCVLAPSMTTAVVQAQSVDQQKQRVEDIVDELERLEEQAIQLGEQYTDVIDTKTALDAEIADAQARIGEKEAQLTELRGNLSEMALRSFVGGGGAPLGPLFEDSDNLNDALKREELAKVALSAGDVTTDELDALVADIEDERKALDRKREQADQLAASLTDAQAETEKLTTEYTKARADAEAKLGTLIREEEERRAAESLRRVQAQARSSQTAATSSSGGNSGGGNSGGGNSGGGTSNGGSTGDSSGSGGGYSAPAVSSRAGLAVQAALAQQGVPYRYATSSPGVGFDCSGLTAYAWGQAGVGLPHQSGAQFGSVPRVAIDQAQPGDLLFFYSPISHVSIYLGNGMQVHAPNTGKTVTVAAVNWGKVVGVGRPG